MSEGSPHDMVKIPVTKAVDQVRPCRDTDQDGMSEIHGPSGPYITILHVIGMMCAHETTATYKSYKCGFKSRLKATYNRFQAPCVLWIDSPVEICLRDANTCQTEFSLILAS